MILQPGRKAKIAILLEVEKDETRSALAKMEAGTKHKAHVEAKNGRALVNARPIPSILGDAGDELQQGAARILVDPPLALGFFRGDPELDDVVVTIIDSTHDIFPVHLRLE